MSPNENCLHCGLPVRTLKGARAHAIFCCYGCEIAYEVLGTEPGERAGRASMYRLAIGGILGINVMMFSMPLYVDSLGEFLRAGGGEYFSLLKWLLLALSTPVFFLLGIPFIESALSRPSGQRINADLLIAIGVSAAFMVSLVNTVFGTGPVYFETAIAILLIMTVGRFLEARIKWKAFQSLGDLESSLPKLAYLLQKDGTTIQTEIDRLSCGDNIVVHPGEIVPVDSVIVSGKASISQALLTGEATPLIRSVGEQLLGGSLNHDGLLHLRVERPVSESYIAKIEQLLCDAKLGKAHVEELADKLSARAVPAILLIAVLALAYWWHIAGFEKGLFTALSVLLIACPCALGVATPAALWVSVTRAARKGILFHSLNALERLASVKTIFFDKTGTLTTGEPVIAGIEFNQRIVDRYFEGDEALLLSAVRDVERGSRHPMARAIVRTLDNNTIDSIAIDSFKEFAGEGVSASALGKDFRIGRRDFVNSERRSDEALLDIEDASSTVWCGVKEMDTDELADMACVLRFEDTLRPEAHASIEDLHSQEMRVVILSGDNKSVVSKLAAHLNTEYLAELLPEDKVSALWHENKKGHATLFVGDGVNDAAAIATATVGIAMGSGTDMAKVNADITLVTADLLLIPHILELSKRTMRVVRQNLAWAFGYNAIGVVIAAFGLLNPILAALAMALSSLAVVQNSLRLKKEVPGA